MLNKKNFKDNFVMIFVLLGVAFINFSSAVLPFYSTVAGDNYSQTMNNIKKHFNLFTEKEYLLFLDYFIIPTLIAFLCFLFAMALIACAKFNVQKLKLLSVIILLIGASVLYLYLSYGILHLALSLSLFITISTYFAVKYFQEIGVRDQLFLI